MLLKRPILERIAAGEVDLAWGLIAGRPIDDKIIEHTVTCIARVRTGDEGREGLQAFLDKRPPRWA